MEGGNQELRRIKGPVARSMGGVGARISARGRTDGRQDGWMDGEAGWDGMEWDDMAWDGTGWEGRIGMASPLASQTKVYCTH